MKKILEDVILPLIIFIIIIIFCLTHQALLFTICPFLNKEVHTYYDNLMVGVIGTAISLIITGLCVALIKLSRDNRKKFMAFMCRKIRKCSNNELKSLILQMDTFMWKTKVRWGVTERSNEIKYANTAEAMIAISYLCPCQEFGYSRRKNRKFQDTCRDVLNNFSLEGYKSVNENAYTIHCTAMILYALKRLENKGIIKIEQAIEDKIYECLQRLLNYANDYGWGFYNCHYDDIDYNRTLSTIWALRALNIWGYEDRDQFKVVLENLIHDENESGLGFCPNSETKKSADALFLILLSEIQNPELVSMIDRSVNRQLIIKRILKGKCPETEVEEFIVSKESYVKRPWTHLCECLVLEALLRNYRYLTTVQIAKMYSIVSQIKAKINREKGYYTVRSMNFRHDDPFFFPTTYVITNFYLLFDIQK